MQIIADIPKRLQGVVAENATTLLTAGGVVGAVATAVLAGRAGFKAGQLSNHDHKAEVEDVRYATSNDMTRLDKIIKTTPLFIPPVATGGLTIAAIIMSHRMSASKAAALAAAYGVSQKQLDEYKAKVAEKLGVSKSEKLDDELAQDRVKRTPEGGQLVVIEGEVLCFDEPTGRYFKSTMEKINRAANSTNAEIATHGYVGAEHFYDELELPPTTWADGVGFNLDNKLELKISSVLTEDDRPCIAIDFRELPKPDYMRIHS